MSIWIGFFQILGINIQNIQVAIALFVVVIAKKSPPKTKPPLNK